MRLTRPHVEFIDELDRDKILQKIEKAARVCYKSESNITPDSASKMVSRLVKSNHLAMIEHGGTITVKIITDRGCSHEIVRHRMASYAQESTRYCNYSKGQFGSELEFIIPANKIDKYPEGKIYPVLENDENGNTNIIDFCTEDEMRLNCEPDDLTLLVSFLFAEYSYKTYLGQGHTPQEARAILPNAIKTEIIVTMNPREWLHFINLRSKGTTGAPHPDIKVVVDEIYKKFHEVLPEIFE